MKNLKMKRLIAMFLAIVGITLLFPMHAIALTSGTGGDGEIVDWGDFVGPAPSAGLQYSQNTDGTYSVSGLGTCTDAEIIVASVYNGAAVTAVKGSAFRNKTAITSVTLPASVKSIGSYAFSGCTGLETVVLSDELTTIETRAFAGCASLKAIAIPQRVSSIASYAFMDCVALESITVDIANVTYRSENNCLIERSTATVIVGCKTSQIPDDVIIIGAHAFRGHTGLTSIELPNVRIIGQNAFYGCTGLTTVTIGDSLQTIDINAFNGCTALTDVYYAESEEVWNATVEISATGNTTFESAKMHFHDHVPTEICIPLDDFFHNTMCECGKMFMVPHRAEMNVSSLGATQHTGLCVCGHTVTEDHTWDEGVIDSFMTLYTCTGCGETRCDIHKGDLNGDGILDEQDVTLLRQFLAGWSVGEWNQITWDLNSDGSIDVVDVALLNRYLHR